MPLCIRSRRNVQASPILKPECSINRTSALIRNARGGEGWLPQALRIFWISSSENGSTDGSAIFGALMDFAGFSLIQLDSWQKRKNDFRCSTVFFAERCLFAQDSRNNLSSSTPKLEMKTVRGFHRTSGAASGPNDICIGRTPKKLPFRPHSYSLCIPAT